MNANVWLRECIYKRLAKKGGDLGALESAAAAEAASVFRKSALRKGTGIKLTLASSRHISLTNRNQGRTTH
jgi:hypothetical protein